MLLICFILIAIINYGTFKTQTEICFCHCKNACHLHLNLICNKLRLSAGLTAKHNLNKLSYECTLCVLTTIARFHSKHNPLKKIKDLRIYTIICACSMPCIAHDSIKSYTRRKTIFPLANHVHQFKVLPPQY